MTCARAASRAPLGLVRAVSTSQVHGLLANATEHPQVIALAHAGVIRDGHQNEGAATDRTHTTERHLRVDWRSGRGLQLELRIQYCGSPRPRRARVAPSAQNRPLAAA